MGVSQLYAARVAEGALHRDPVQEAALAPLERVRRDLEEPAAKGLLKRFSAPRPVRGLYLWGGVGRGKSMLMDMFAETVTVPARRVHFHAFMQEVHAGLNLARKKGAEDAIVPVADDIISQVRLLAFDEMQITDIADAMIVGRLFERLFAAGVCIVTTSNRHPDDLYKDGLNRQLFLPFIELVKERMEVFELASDTDYRQNRLASQPTYFTPINAEARAAIQSVWADLTGGDTEELVLSVNGRKVVLPAYRNGIGRASFYELCAKPLGAADYLAIADAVKVLVVDNIPCLSRSNFNEAKRFVLLVDALYEARVKLIASAEAVPEMLYLEGEGTFEFERTASRLREMQSESWTGARGA